MRMMLFGLTGITLVAAGSLAPAKAQTPGGMTAAQGSRSQPLVVQAPDNAAPAASSRPSETASSFQRENPTGRPWYEMRPDGLMINGLLPAHGWKG
jgi:hypothetical protein